MLALPGDKVDATAPKTKLTLILRSERIQKPETLEKHCPAFSNEGPPISMKFQ